MSVTSKVLAAVVAAVVVVMAPGWMPILEATSWWLAPALISLAASSITCELVFWLLNMLVLATRPVRSAVAISAEIVIGGLMA